MSSMITCSTILQSILSDTGQTEIMSRTDEIRIACIQWDAAVRAATVQAKATESAGIATAVAGLLAFAGVVFAGKFALKGVQQQIEAESKLRKIDRDQSIKREIYLGAIEAFFLNLMNMPRLMFYDISNESILKDYLNASSKISHIHAVADIETARLTVLAVSKFGMAQNELIARRSEMIHLHNKIGRLSEGLEKQSLNSKMKIEQRTLACLALKHIEDLNEPICNAVIAMREEIFMPVDKEKYKLAIREIVAQTISQSRNFLED